MSMSHFHCPEQENRKKGGKKKNQLATRDGLTYPDIAILGRVVSHGSTRMLHA